MALVVVIAVERRGEFCESRSVASCSGRGRGVKLISLLHTWRNFKSLSPAAVAKRRRVSLISPPLPEEISMKQGIKSQKTTLPSVEYARLLFLSLALAFVNTRQRRAISPARMETNASPLHNLIANKYPHVRGIYNAQKSLSPNAPERQAPGSTWLDNKGRKNRIPTLLPTPFSSSPIHRRRRASPSSFVSSAARGRARKINLLPVYSVGTAAGRTGLGPLTRTRMKRGGGIPVQTGPGVGNIRRRRRRWAGLAQARRTMVVFLCLEMGFARFGGRRRRQDTAGN